MDLSEPQDIDSPHIEGIHTLVKGCLGWKVYRGVGTRMSTIKFTLAGT